MVKKLRYYARFIVVCLLLKKTNQVSELIKELSRQIDEYVKIFDPEDQLEWQLVKNEINDFIKADTVVTVDADTSQVNSKMFLADRLSSNDLASLSISNNHINNFYKSASNSMFTFSNVNNSNNNSQHFLSLQEILIVGNCSDQVKKNS
jgi:hypothetical protein